MSADAPLPRTVNPRKLAVSGGAVSGEIALVGMRRLADFLGCSPDDLTTRAVMAVAFSEDAQRRVTAHGRLEATLPMACRVCEQRSDVPVSSHVQVAIVANEDDGADLPRDLEPLVVQDDRLDVMAWVEDELILAAPVAPACVRAACQPSVQPEPDRTEAGGKRAFAGLKRMMDDADGGDESSGRGE
jgi:uncharacterized protein